MAKEQPRDEFPLSQKKIVKGTRHLAREKVFQILVATLDGDVSLDVVFPHVFYRQFTFDPAEATTQRILKPDEVRELEADVPIDWHDVDIEYARTVLMAERDLRDEVTKRIEALVTNWDFERIANLDLILMRLAYVELVACPDIDVKVTLNETIELAKRFSTDKSGTFINGVLDAIIDALKKEGRIRKTGRARLDD